MDLNEQKPRMHCAGLCCCADSRIDIVAGQMPLAEGDHTARIPLAKRRIRALEIACELLEQRMLRENQA